VVQAASMQSVFTYNSIMATAYYLVLTC